MTQSAAAARDELLQRAMPGGTLALRLRVDARPGTALRLFESRPGEDRFYWEQPSADFALCAVGAVHRVEARGPARFELAAESSRALFGALALAGEPAPASAGPLLVGGFAFESEAAASSSSAWRDFSPLSFVLPELLYVRDGARAWLTVARPVGGAPRAAADRLLSSAESCAAALAAPDGDAVLHHPPATASEYCARPDRPHARWLEQVEAAVDAIRRGDFQKVVLARSLGVESDVAYDIVAVLAALRAVERSCTTFAVTRGERSFLGASPERLVRLSGDQLSTSALAGSAPRGRSPEEDERFARSLRESKKEQEEHAFVAREIAAALEPLCERIAFPEAPDLLTLDGIQHLETPFVARLRDGLDPRPHLFDLAARLHPTPAVCGSPRECAADWLREHEQLERGWYAGGVGYVDARGSGELAVSLRSGLLHGCSARLYAGAGLVDASQPEAELAETRLKLRALLSQLTEI
ncbi:MAG: isochorismate synthase [Myxococcota bacterium]|nr:isochorismate synthase [Myxococcota bacterium]